MGLAITQKENGIRSWRKVVLVLYSDKILAKSCSTIRWKSKLVTDAFGYLDEDICKHRAEGMAWILGVVYSKMQEERGRWKELFNKKEIALDNLEILCLLRLQKTLKLGDPLSYSGKKPKGVVRQPFAHALEGS